MQYLDVTKIKRMDQTAVKHREIFVGNLRELRKKYKENVNITPL